MNMMTGWLKLSEDQRRIVIEQASIHSGIRREAIEKDWWVTLALKALFELSYSEHFIFKGGTSLSKGWGLIKRISEDIDIALAPESFGEKYEVAPSHSYVKKLKREGFAFTSKTITDAFETKLYSYGLSSSQIEIVAAPMPEGRPDTDPQTIYMRYHSLFPQHLYIENQIRIEFSVRSMKEPYESVPIQSMLWQYFPNEAYREVPFQVNATLPRKTFIEKIFLLHEKFLIPGNENIAVERQSRHLYDLVKLADEGIMEEVLRDMDLYHRLVEHRKYWIRFKGIDYETLSPRTISFIPPDNLILKFKDDYKVMQESLIYESFYDFDKLIEHLREMNKRFNNLG